MAQHQNLSQLMEILLGQQQDQLDPRALFLADVVKQRTAAGFQGDQTSDINTVLDLLSPGQTAALREDRGGPQRLQQVTGLDQENIASLIKQQFGLEESTAQRSKRLFDEFKVRLEQQPKLIEARAKQREAASGEKATDAKIAQSKKELALEEDKLAFEKSQFDAKLAGQTPADQALMIDSNLKVMASTQKDLLGNNITPEEQRNAFRVIQGDNDFQGQLLPLISQLIAAGEEENLAKILNALGVDATFVDRWWPFANSISIEGFPQGGVEPVPGQGTELGTIDPDTQAILDEMKRSLGEAIGPR